MSLIEDLQAAIFGVDISEGENWNDRLAEAAYTTPSGLRITFDYEDLSHSFEKKTTAFEFPDVDGTLVQDKGRTGQKFPWRIFFWGADVDRKATVFEAAMMERGFGQLETPLYGKFTVVPFGEITRIDALKSAANQVVFEVTFWETIEGPYPATTQDAANAALTALELFNDSSAAAFATSLSQGSISEEQGLLDTLNDLVDQVGDVLDTIAAVQAVVQDALNDAFDVVDNALQTFVGDPLTLAFNVQTMIQTPATAMGNINAQLDAYGNLAADIFGTQTSGPGGPGGLGPQLDSDTGAGNDAQETNAFHARNLFASSLVASSALSTLYTNTRTGGAASVTGVKRRQRDADNEGVSAAGNTFNTAEEALAAADRLLQQLADLTTWKDINFEAMAGGDLTADERARLLTTPINIDDGNAQRHLTDVISLTAGFLIQLSFTLKRGTRITLQNDRGLIDLVSELYGDIEDDTLNFFIDSNNLAVDSILEIKKGTEIVYYV